MGVTGCIGIGGVVSMKISKASYGFLLGLAIVAMVRFFGGAESAFLTGTLFIIEIAAIFSLARDWWRYQDDVTTRHWRG